MTEILIIPAPPFVQNKVFNWSVDHFFYKPSTFWIGTSNRALFFYEHFFWIKFNNFTFGYFWGNWHGFVWNINGYHKLELFVSTCSHFFASWWFCLVCLRQWKEAMALEHACMSHMDLVGHLIHAWQVLHGWQASPRVWLTAYTHMSTTCFHSCLVCRCVED